MAKSRAPKTKTVAPDQEQPDPNATSAADGSGAPVSLSEVGTPATEAVETGLADLQGQLQEALEQAERYREQALRAEAEMQNVRRRASRDVENAHKFGIERLLLGLLPTVDSLEKAVASAQQDEATNRAILEGIEICLKMLMDVLVKENVVQIDPEGEPFNPAYHQAIQVLVREDMEPNSVALVIQKGYILNERLVRPAMVIVSKGVEAK